MTKHYDVVISGGGAVGLSLAIGLTQQGIESIALIEPVINETPISDKDDARVIALSNGSVQFVRSLLKQNDIAGSTPIKSIHVTDKGHLGQCVINSQEYNVEELGLVIRQGVLTRTLEKSLDLDTVDVYRPFELHDVELKNNGVQIRLNSNQCIEGNLLVIAEGTQSKTRDKLGVQFTQTPYSQCALVANVQVKQAHNFTAFERFTKRGPIALLPLENQWYSLVWTMSEQDVEYYMSIANVDFLRHLQDAFGYRAGIFNDVGHRYHYPLLLMKPAQQIGHRWVLMGNAMHTLHPIAGQGLNLGLRDVQDFIVNMQDSKNQEDLGQHEFLLRFQQMRSQDIHRTITMTDGLVRLFSNSYWPLIIGRNLALKLMNTFSVAKAPLVKQALGWRSE